MFEKLRKDYARYACKKSAIFGMPLMFLYDAGFRAVVIYRCGNWCRKHKSVIMSKILERAMHHLCHCWISTAAEIGEGLLVAHVCGLVIGGGTVIGKNCDVRQNVTLGGNFNKRDAEGRLYPILGDNVSLGAGSVVIGPVKVGNNSIVGSNAVVTKDVPENVIVGGVPAKIIKQRWPENSGRQL